MQNFRYWLDNFLFWKLQRYLPYPLEEWLNTFRREIIRDYNDKRNWYE